MTAPELTLNEVKKQIRPKNRVVRVSDFLSNEEKMHIKLVRQEKSAQKRRGFDEVDSYSAEILARFGYDTWLAWKDGRIEMRKMARMIRAERAREKQLLIGLESIIVSAMSGANHPDKHGKPPKSLKNAINILKVEQKAARGLANG